MLRWVALAFAVGVAVGEWLRVPRAWALGMAVVAVVLVCLARRRGRLVGVGALGLAVGAGVVAVAGARPRAPPMLVDGAPWTVEAEVVRAPQRTVEVTHVLVALRAVERGAQRRTASGRVRVAMVGPPVEPLLPGDRVRFTAILRAPRGFLNPGAVDTARRAAADGVIALASVHEPAALTRLAVDGSDGVLRQIAAARARLLALVERRLAGERRALVASLVLGDRSEIGRPLDDAFRVAGVSHVLSVSGLHLAIAAFLFYAGLTRALLRVPGLGRGWPVRRWAAAAGLPATAIYTWLTGAEVATVSQV
jgi:competence protein ComEC